MNGAQPTSPYKELRLGLVCYGGVSLAIYMHGQIKEVHKLVVASRAFEKDPTQNPFPEGTTERAYWDVLRDVAKRQKVSTRVIVDVISGTSAGGINGIMLAKALAQNRQQESLTELWFDRGDIKQLVGGWWRLPLKLVGLAASPLPFVRSNAPLRGNHMLRWLRDAFVGIDNSTPPKGVETFDSLVPRGQDLELFVTTTDFYGYTRALVIADPESVEEKRHRHVFRFRHGAARETTPDRQFRGEYNEMLALAARATSSFPGAFPPVEFAQLKDVLKASPEQLETYREQFFREYQLTGEDVDDAFFVDGGVIDNKPFGHTLGAIVDKTSAVEVDRRLIYLEPDPRYTPPKDDPGRPSVVRTAWGGLSSVASYEPILDDILAVDEHNRRVDRVDSLISDCRGDVLKMLRSVGAFDTGAKKKEFAILREDIERGVRDLLGTAAKAHHLLRVHSVLDQFAWGISYLRGFPPTTNENGWVRLIVHKWAVGEGYLRNSRAGKEADAEEQQALLDGFDLGYTRRRIQLVMQGVDALYKALGPEGEGNPSREQLDAAKAVLNDALVQVLDLIWGRDLPEGEGTDPAETLSALFPLPDFDFQEQSLDSYAQAWVENADNVAELNHLQATLGAYLRYRREAIRRQLYEGFQEVTEEWPEEIRQDILVRYLGFPFWDALIYPILALSAAGELDRIEVVRMSPEDAAILHPGPGRTEAKVKGIGYGHFEAFFRRKYRENDYLWGRLDAVERLIGLVAGTSSPDASTVKPALQAVLAEERDRLGTIPETVERLERTVSQLP